MADNDIDSYLRSMGAKPSSGSEVVLDCPFCGKKGRLYVNTEPREEYGGKAKPAGRWICFACGKKSLEFAGLLAELDGISFHEARSTMGKWKMGGIRFRRPAEHLADVQTAEWLPAEFESVRKVWPRYLDSRNITKETAYQFNLGVCRSGKMAHRIILPIDCPAGKSYQARAILPHTEPRYLSGDNSGQLLFGWHTIEQTDLAILVEGPFDCINVAQAGLPCVALMGKQLRDSQYEMLRKRRRRYIVALDPMTKDKTAIDNACDIAHQLSGSVVFGMLTDPGDATVAQIQHAVTQLALPPREARAKVLQHRLSDLIEKHSSR